MKFRTDFVTNSSSSSFLTFNIKNEKLYNALSNLGIKFKSKKTGEFSDCMLVILPSGKCGNLSGDPDALYAITGASRYSSISAWLIENMLESCEPEFYYSEDEEDEDEEDEDEEKWDEYDDEDKYKWREDFKKELFNLLMKIDMDKFDWKDDFRMLQEISRSDKERLEHEFDKYDGYILSANINVGATFESEISDFERLTVNGEERKVITADGDLFGDVFVYDENNYYGGEDKWEVQEDSYAVNIKKEIWRDGKWVNVDEEK